MLLAALVALTLGYGTWLLRRRFPALDRAANGIVGRETGRITSSAPAHGRYWPLLGFLVLVAALALLEGMQSYYFTQDDALVSELPGILVGCRGVWQGHWPNYNPYVFMGAPLLNLGLYSLTYPPTYLAYGIAREFLHDEYATLEVFAILHLLVGYVATYAVARRTGMGPLPATLASLSFVLSGSILIMGRSWHTFVTAAVWLPILVAGLARLREGPVGWRWVLGIGLALGLVFQVGFPQLAVYELGFFVVGVLGLAVMRLVPWRRSLIAVPAIL